MRAARAPKAPTWGAWIREWTRPPILLAVLSLFAAGAWATIGLDNMRDMRDQIVAARIENASLKARVDGLERREGQR